MWTPLNQILRDEHDKLNDGIKLAPHHIEIEMIRRRPYPILGRKQPQAGARSRWRRRDGEVEGADGGRRLLLDAEAAMDGGSEAVHSLARAADPVADRENQALEGPHGCPWCCSTPARSSACLVGWGLPPAAALRA